VNFGRPIITTRFADDLLEGFGVRDYFVGLHQRATSVVPPHLAEVNLDMFNALNSAAILAVNSAFGPPWRRPTTILTGRLIEVSARMSF
jgi:hypothetical protein